MNPYVCVVGAVNLDICGRPSRKLIFRDSNPGTVTLTPGGVGRNIAHDLRLLGVEVKFLTAFGGDSHAQLLRNDCVELGMDLGCALDVPGGRTSTYLYITDERGEMQLGLSDTDISAAITPDYLSRHLDELNGAAAVAIDGNLTSETIAWLGAHCTAPLFADPVSVTKAERMRPALGALHTFKPNLTEGQNLTGESSPEGVVAALLAQGVQRVFLSMGATAFSPQRVTKRCTCRACPPAWSTRPAGETRSWRRSSGRILRGSTCVRPRRPLCAPERPRSNIPARTTPTSACSSTAEGRKTQEAGFRFRKPASVHMCTAMRYTSAAAHQATAQYPAAAANAASLLPSS